MKKLLIASACVLAGLWGLQRFRPAADKSAETAPPLRIVSMAPNLTGVLFDLGAGSSVVGVTAYCDYPPEAATREKIGDFINPNIEKIVSLRPDLVVCERWTSSKTAPRLRRLGLRVHEAATPDSLEGVYGLVREIGDLVDRPAQAQALVERLQARVEAVERRAAAFPRRPRVYLEIDLPAWTVGSANFTNEAIRIAGGENVFSDLSSPASLVSQEAVIDRNPDVIVSFVANAEEIRRRAGWDAISAVQHGRIIDDFNESLLSQGNGRLVEGMELLQTRLREVMGY